MKIQVSFLGKSRSSPSTGYRSANYCFEDGSIATTAFLGFELARRERPDRLYILGTSGSMWDLLLDAFVSPTIAEESVLALWEQSSKGQTDETLLGGFEPVLSQSLGIECHLRVIPYARHETEQSALLARLAEWIGEGDELILDVTHGFRHLPMLMLAASYYLKHVRKAKVKDIFYGALDMTENDITPVLGLKGILRILDWVQGLSAFESSGNYSVFGQLVESAGLDGGHDNLLRQAAFFERTTNPVKARENLTSVKLDQLDDPMYTLFREELVRSTGWWRKGNRGDWEAALAWKWFDRHDYMRAAIFTQESLISRNMGNAPTDDYDARENIRNTLKKENRDAAKLFRLRNAMAHGLRSQDNKTNNVLKNEYLLHTELQDLMLSLIGRTPQSRVS